MKKLAILFLLAAVTALSGCSGSNGGSSAQPQNNAPYAYDNASNGAGNAGDTDPVMYSVSVVVNYIENIAANKYSIRLYIDGEDYGMIEQGNEATYTVNLYEGSHTLKIVNSTNESDADSQSFSVKSDGYRYAFSCKAKWGGLKLSDPSKIPV